MALQVEIVCAIRLCLCLLKSMRTGGDESRHCRGELRMRTLRSALECGVKSVFVKGTSEMNEFALCSSTAHN